MRRILPTNLDLALLILRLTLATILLYHGLPKLMHFGPAVAGFQQLGLPAPTVTAGFALIAEVVGGLLILLGVASDLGAILVIIDMLGAIALVHWANGFDFTKGGWEHPFTVLAVALALALAGPGRHTIASKRGAKGTERRRK
jgi:putative oxidoreductase